MRLDTALSDHTFELSGLGSAPALLENIEHIGAWRCSQQVKQSGEVGCADGPPPLVLAIATDECAFGAEVLAIDVEIFVAVEVSAEVTAIRSIDLVAQCELSVGFAHALSVPHGRDRWLSPGGDADARTIGHLKSVRV
jgi:hypothetical protein